ncbi:MAG: hypothetical protein HKN68_21920 [Saprospiraceae bacterium]|nr:hypothetical protein [Saprospiraceae bacterium]
MNFKNLLLVAGLIIVISSISYYFLGGLNDIQYSIQSAKPYNLIGKEYSGSNSSIKLKSIYDQMKELLDSTFPGGVLVIVNDESQYDPEDNKVWYFIGIIPKSSTYPEQIPEDYIVRRFNSKKIVRAKIEAHNLVMPKPEKVRDQARTLAEREGLELSQYSIEKYLDEGVMEIDFLVKD